MTPAQARHAAPPQPLADRPANAAQEPLLSSFLHASVLAHSSFERCLAFILAHRLASPILQELELFELFCSVLEQRPEIAAAAAADVRAVRQRVSTWCCCRAVLASGLHSGVCCPWRLYHSLMY